MFKKMYLLILYVLVNLFLVFGVITPYLISAKADELVVIGIVIILGDITHLVFLIKNFITNLNEKSK